jgi:predicted AAA+ superfamily ATPase
MLVQKGQDLRAFIDEKTEEITNSRDFVSQIESYMGRKTSRGVLVTGLRSTGKTVGILQGIKGCSFDKMIYVSPLSRDEQVTKEQVKRVLEEYNADVIVVDEYSWIKGDDEDDTLSAYLSAQAQMGKKVFVTGTDSCTVFALNNKDFIHRAININTTYFSYDEYCRVYGQKQCADSMEQYLLNGGIFENHILNSFESMKYYIRTAIIENLASYYQRYDKELIKAAIYTIFYDSVCNLYSKKDKERAVPLYKFDTVSRELSYEEYLEEFGIDPSLSIPLSVLREVAGELTNIGVVVVLDDLRRPNKQRSYITNQAITAQMTKCIYGVSKLDHAYIGHLYEASVVCNVYMKYLYKTDSFYKMNFLEGRTNQTDYEIDFILSNSDDAYLFECKYDDNSQMKISDKASIVKDIIPNLLGDKSVQGRFILYRGEEKCGTANGYDLVFTNDWSVKFSEFKKMLEELKKRETGYHTPLIVDLTDEQAAASQNSSSEKAEDTVLR